MHRDRSQGWRHAKISGHANETNLAELLQSPKELRNLSQRIRADAEALWAAAGGISASRVPCILGGMTTPKPDLTIAWDDGTHTQVSIKKSTAGQLFLISTDRFIEGFEAHYGRVPTHVREALQLFIGGEQADYVREQIAPFSSRVRQTERSHHRLVWQTLRSYDSSLADDMLAWLRASIEDVADFCFARGLAASDCDWAEVVWYRNTVAENELDDIYSVCEIARACGLNRDKVIPGPRNGGSTLLLPFGFLQWHQAQMQFHHQHTAVTELGVVPR